GVTRDSLVTRPHGREGQAADDLHVLLLSGTTAKLCGDALEDTELPVVDDGLPRDLEGNTVLLGLESLTRGTEPDALVLTVLRHAGEGTLEVRLTSGRVSDVRVRAVPLGGEIVLRTEVIDNLTRGDLGPDPRLILVLIQHDLVERRGEQGRVVRGRDTLNQTLLSLAVAVKRLSHDLSGLNLPLGKSLSHSYVSYQAAGATSVDWTNLNQAMPVPVPLARVAMPTTLLPSSSSAVRVATTAGSVPAGAAVDVYTAWPTVSAPSPYAFAIPTTAIVA